MALRQIVFVCFYLISCSSWAELKKPLRYIYQSQDMKVVNWLYVGFAPRQQDPSLVRVTLSKGGYTMKVILQLTKRDLADYPAYLVRRRQVVERVISSEKLSVYDVNRLLNFYEETDRLSKNTEMGLYYSENKYQWGRDTLKRHFPKNYFEVPEAADKGPDQVVGEAVFVYPITINKGGKTWPPDGEYIQSRAYSSVYGAVQERRTDHGKYIPVDDNGDGKADRTVRIVADHIFSGFPAFWIDNAGRGTGVHGPIRYSEKYESGGQSGPYGSGSEAMMRFWQENEFGEFARPKTSYQGVELRWDVVRTNNSAGCFRAETMELRHLLPSDPKVIHRNIQWEVISDVDTYRPPQKNKTYYVDVNYYLVNPYRKPLSREKWILQRWVDSADANPNESLENFKASSLQFPYLDPSTVEFKVPGEFSESKSLNIMSKLNRAGGVD